ncbi:(2Fe-2S)-binding protein [Neobacillus mesonae]|uniref:Pyridine nucleotide-disulfide oxidoreductase n=1 Tax=Neobacillus mesonae TaxID=1193713 RepID=A0A3T0I313_9BACI|nr:(2Fe-2S)-binding protein [Neobacillus mesonae]AZU63707.1 pyridine nucleotide-disulfide oxidoreductase [Neobacillus mesonae]MED4207306.1 (2Fe-2S)-binding protein [Neobacillus mesonae]
MTKHDDLVICRCEEVTYGQLLSTANEHKCTARELKLRTRAGMGFCGGRTCRMAVDNIIESVIPNITQADIPLKYQPPIRPVTFGSVGEIK